MNRRALNHILYLRPCLHIHSHSHTPAEISGKYLSEGKNFSEWNWFKFCLRQLRLNNSVVCSSHAIELQCFYPWLKRGQNESKKWSQSMSMSSSSLKNWNKLWLLSTSWVLHVWSIGTVFLSFRTLFYSCFSCGRSNFVINIWIKCTLKFIMAVLKQ